jgi:hypothetical protein
VHRPQDCPEVRLTAQTVQYGYKESFADAGITEAKELELSLAHRADLWSSARLQALRQVRSAV